MKLNLLKKKQAIGEGWEGGSVVCNRAMKKSTKSSQQKNRDLSKE